MTVARSLVLLLFTAGCAHCFTAPIAHRSVSFPTMSRYFFGNLFSSSTDDEKTDSEPAVKEKAPGHDVKSTGTVLPLDPEEMKVQERLAEHQQNAPKLGWAVDIRTLVQYNHGFAVMSTNSKS